MSRDESNQLVKVDERVLSVKRMLAGQAKAFEAALARSMPFEKFARIVTTAVSTSPQLASCTAASIGLAALRIAQLQLSPDPVVGQAWIIPRKGRAEFQLGFRGALALAYRSPLVRAVRYGLVAKGEEFHWVDGRHWELVHHPGEGGWPQSFDDIAAAWVVIETTRGGEIPRVMRNAELARHRARSDAFKSGRHSPWVSDPAPMAVKVVLDEAAMRGPIEAELQRAFLMDHHGEAGVGQPADPALEAEFELLADEASGEAASELDRFKMEHGEQEDKVGDALDGADRPAGSLPPEQVEKVDDLARGRVLEYARALGYEEDEVGSVIGGPLASLPADLETVAMGKLKAKGKKQSKRG